MKRCTKTAPEKLTNPPIATMKIEHDQYVGISITKDYVDNDALMELYNKVNEIIEYLDRPTPGKKEGK